MLTIGGSGAVPRLPLGNLMRVLVWPLHAGNVKSADLSLPLRPIKPFPFKELSNPSTTKYNLKARHELSSTFVVFANVTVH